MLLFSEQLHHRCSVWSECQPLSIVDNRQQHRTYIGGGVGGGVVAMAVKMLPYEVSQASYVSSFVKATLEVPVQVIGRYVH